MLYEHLDLTKEEAIKRYHKDYENEIKTFDEIEKQAIMMANYLSSGIEKQNRSN